MTHQTKPGRPILRDEVMTDILAVRFTPRERQILRDYAWRYQLSQSEVVRFCLEIMGVLPNSPAPQPIHK